MSYVVKALFRLLNLVPMTWAVAATKGIARLLILLNAKIVQVARTNIEHCFSSLSTKAKQRMLSETVANAALLIFEFAYFRHRPINELLDLVAGVEGEDKLKEAWAAGEGVILLVPHFGCWEFLNTYLGHKYPISALYDPPKVLALEDSIVATRQRQGTKMHPTTASGLRGLTRGLKSGDLVAVLPDQVPPESAGRIIAPFFGRKALTMSLAKRLMRVGSPKVLMAAAWRDTQQGQLRYRVCFEEPEPEIYSDDDIAHATAMNLGLERITNRAPAQYQWTYKRFKGFADETDAIYRRQ